MPRYHFHVTDDGDYIDTEGTELPDIDTAMAEAMRFAGASISETKLFWRDRDWHMRVTDDANLTLFDLTLFGTTSAAVSRG